MMNLEIAISKEQTEAIIKACVKEYLNEANIKECVKECVNEYIAAQTPSYLNEMFHTFCLNEAKKIIAEKDINALANRVLTHQVKQELATAIINDIASNIYEGFKNRFDW